MTTSMIYVELSLPVNVSYCTTENAGIRKIFDWHWTKSPKQCCGSGSGIGKNQDPGSGPGMNILDHIFASLETNFWVKIPKLFDAVADPGSVNLFEPGSGIRDEKNSDPG
jgi:hypothetical protein